MKSISGIFGSKVDTEFGKMSKKRQESLTLFVSENIRTTYHARLVKNLAVNWNKAGEIEVRDFEEVEYVPEDWASFYCNECEQEFTDVKSMIEHIFIHHPEFLED